MEHGILAWLAIGLVLGIGAQFLIGGFDFAGWFATVLTGMVGASIAGWVTAHALGWSDENGYFALLAAFVGATLVLWVMDVVVPRRPY